MNNVNFTEQDFKQILESSLNISNALSILEGYCCFHDENEKIAPVLFIVKSIQIEFEKITNTF